MKAFILITAEVGRESAVVERLRRLQQTEFAHSVYGGYDVVALVDVSTPDELKQLVSGKIRSFPEVKSTATMMIIE